MSDPLEDLRFSDITTFLKVAETRGVAVAARHLHVTSSQVSKAITRLEDRLGARLFERSARGVVLTGEGDRLMPRLRQIVLDLRGLAREDEPSNIAITIAAPSFIAATVAPIISANVPGVRTRVLEMAPAVIRATLSEQQFDIAFLPGADPQIRGWHVEPIGLLRMGLFASPALAKSLPTPLVSSVVAEIPFISPLRTSANAIAPSDDGCPLSPTERKLGDEVQTFAVGLELAATTRQFVFGPVTAAQRYLDAGLLVECAVKGWHVEGIVQFACSETLLSRVRREVLKAIRGHKTIVKGFRLASRES